MPENSNKAGLPLVIVNPVSAGGATRERWSGIAADLRSHFGPFTVAFTKAEGDGISIARKFIALGRRFLVACGGDGTINEVANGILQSGEDVELGIVPAGTGGDLRRSLGISLTPREAARELKSGVAKRIDVGRVGFVDHEGREVTRHFLNVASFGLSASINSRVRSKGELRWLPGESIRGKTKFAISTLQEILGGESKTVQVTVDDNPASGLNTLNFCVCNGRFFGGGMKIAPEADLCDGLLDLVNIGDIRTGRILMNAHKLYRGTHTGLPEVKSRHVSRLSVRAASGKEQIGLEIDGELPGTLPASFEVVPKALSVRFPG